MTKDKRPWLKLFASEKGGSYDAFFQRPFQYILLKYCAQDVIFLPKLLAVYARRLQTSFAWEVEAETISRVAQSQSTSFCDKGNHMAIGPRFTRRYVTPTCDRHLLDLG